MITSKQINFISLVTLIVNTAAWAQPPHQSAANVRTPISQQALRQTPHIEELFPTGTAAQQSYFRWVLYYLLWTTYETDRPMFLKGGQLIQDFNEQVTELLKAIRQSEHRLLDAEREQGVIADLEEEAKRLREELYADRPKLYPLQVKERDLEIAEIDDKIEQRKVHRKNLVEDDSVQVEQNKLKTKALLLSQWIAEEFKKEAQIAIDSRREDSTEKIEHDLKSELFELEFTPGEDLSLKDPANHKAVAEYAAILERPLAIRQTVGKNLIQAVRGWLALLDRVNTSFQLKPEYRDELTQKIQTLENKWNPPPLPGIGVSFLGSVGLAFLTHACMVSPSIGGIIISSCSAGCSFAAGILSIEGFYNWISMRKSKNRVLQKILKFEQMKGASSQLLLTPPKSREKKDESLIQLETRLQPLRHSLSELSDVTLRIFENPLGGFFERSDDKQLRLAHQVMQTLTISYQAGVPLETSKHPLHSCVKLLVESF